MFKGKAIYKPSGKAGEYAQWACNYFVGCSNDCDYCYCKKGVLATVAGGPQATLKKCFRDYQHAFETFVKEMLGHVGPRKQRYMLIRDAGGLFFSFSSDPCLPETIELTLLSVMFATGLGVPCQILTKCTDWLKNETNFKTILSVKNLVSIGFTLTGMDLMEKGPTVASNDERIAALKRLHKNGFKTFASIEPVIDLRKALTVIHKSAGSVDEYKIGLLSGNKNYDWDELNLFTVDVNALAKFYGAKVYWKKSVSNFLGVELNTHAQ